MTPQHDRAASTATFGEWVSEKARNAGYQIDGIRSGGKKALAEATGMSHATVSRLLSGHGCPNPRHFEALARALNVPLLDVLAESGMVSREVLFTAPAGTEVQTARDVAAVAGITTDEGARMLADAIERIKMKEGSALTGRSAAAAS